MRIDEVKQLITEEVGSSTMDLIDELVKLKKIELIQDLLSIKSMPNTDKQGVLEAKERRGELSKKDVDDILELTRS